MRRAHPRIREDRSKCYLMFKRPLEQHLDVKPIEVAAPEISPMQLADLGGFEPAWMIVVLRSSRFSDMSRPETGTGSRIVSRVMWYRVSRQPHAIAVPQTVEGCRTCPGSHTGTIANQAMMIDANRQVPREVRGTLQLQSYAQLVMQRCQVDPWRPAPLRPPEFPRLRLDSFRWFRGRQDRTSAWPLLTLS